MIIITILTLIVAISLQNVNTKISPIIFARITSIFFLYAAFLSFNVLYIQSLGSGIGIYSGYYQVTSISQSIEVFIYLVGALILIPWYPSKYTESLETTSVNQLVEGSVKRSDNTGLIVEAHTSSSPVLSEYSLILLFTTLGGSLLISSSDLISMYLSIELQSFAVYILATIYRDSESATSAGLKYFLLGGLSSCFILLGCGLIYSFTGLTNLESIYSLVSVPSVGLSELVETNTLAHYASSMEDGAGVGRGYLLGLIIIVVGFLFKIAAAPFHNWAPDVYDEVPTIVTTWLTIMPKISIIIFLLELESGLLLPSAIGAGLNSGINIDSASWPSLIYPLSELANLVSVENSVQTWPTAPDAQAGWTLEGMSSLKNLFLISSLLSLIIGTVVGLAQYKIKRLLAYSTISHVGFLLLALAVNTEQSIESLIFYILQYSITNLNTFLILLVFGYTINSYVKFNTLNKNNTSSLDIKFISELKAQFISNPLLSLSLAVCLFSMAGIPPLIGFFAKQQVLYSATYSGYFFLSIVAILVSVISASYYLQIIKVIHFPSNDSNKIEFNGATDKDELKDKDTNNLQIIKANYVYITNIHSMTISILTLTILLFILNPSLILNSTHLLALSIFNC